MSNPAGLLQSSPPGSAQRESDLEPNAQFYRVYRDLAFLIPGSLGLREEGVPDVPTEYPAFAELPLQAAAQVKGEMGIVGIIGGVPVGIPHGGPHAQVEEWVPVSVGATASRIIL